METANRGEVLTRWIAKLGGKKTLGVVEGGGDGAEHDGNDDDDPDAFS